MDLFDRIAEHNMDAEQNDHRREFMVARAMDALEDGVALLLNMPEAEPLTIAWIPEDGNTIDLIEVKELTLDVRGFAEGFTVSPDREYACFLERSLGTIYRFEWPL